MGAFYLFSYWFGFAILCILLLIASAFLGYCLYVKYIHLKYDHIPGPPRDSFLFGHAPTMIEETRSGRNLHDKFLQWSEMYGPVYRINSLHMVIIGVTCPEATKEILMSPKYPKDKLLYARLFNLFGVRFLGSGLVSATNHEQWYKQRRIMDPAFSTLYLRGLMGTFNERAENLMDELTKLADSKKEAKMHQLLSRVTLDVITKVAFGMDLDLVNNDSPFLKAIETCLKGMVANLRDLFFQYKQKNRPFIKEVREACQFLRTTGEDWISKRRTAVQNGEDVPKDILTQIIKSAGQGCDTNTILQNCNTALVILQFLVSVTRGLRLFFLLVLKETLRLYPSAPGLSREVSSDITIAGYDIPGGTIQMFDTYVNGRMDKFFKDPLTFDPDRFHPDATKPYYCYFPFALGARSCLGQKFAQMEAKVVMAKLLQRFDFSLVPGQSFDILDTGTLRPKSGVVCNIKHRDQ
uniref:Cholesterol 24-hydroxylase-like n=1 Tax=Gadus morhua TaxID=8049 RepID=A0A8C4ZSD4_GADMO